MSCLLRRRNPELAVLTETWLNGSFGESAIKMENYVTVRKDRTSGRGGGVLCYVRDSFSYSVIGEHEVPSLSCLKSEVLCVFIRELFLSVIVIYHPFWNDNDADTQAISCITDIVDFIYITHGQNARIILCGDFNDLRHRFSEISLLTHLKSVVNFSTRQGHTLDQVFVNFATSHPASKLAPIGSSDHCVVI